MNKAELIAAIAAETDVTTAKAEKALAVILEGITHTLSDGQAISFIGFGSFVVKQRSARKVRNPKTGEEMMVPAKKVVSFKAGQKLKDSVNSKK